MKSLGINIGSSSIKAVMLEKDAIVWSEVKEHEGSFLKTLKEILDSGKIENDLQCLVTGTEGRKLLKINNVIESLCIERALKQLDIDVSAVVSLGGEDFVVYTIDSKGSIITSFSGNKCASGTGEFFKQQLGRMNMGLNDLDSVPEKCKVHSLSSRCSVFMKSDCTHKLNKGEATKADIVLSLSDVMASKVADFLKKARIKTGRILLTGGVTQNRFIIDFIRDKLPDIEIIVPEEAPYFEAYGAALLAEEAGSKYPGIDELVNPNEVDFSRYPSLKEASARVTYIDSHRGSFKENGEYILGIDGGSTTTKCVLIDIETNEIVASHYGRTHGDPIQALKNCLIEIKKQKEIAIGDSQISISIAATTGSSREILGVFLETPAIYNEIIAHAVGTTYFKSDIDTIFEIGGQDAKYVLIKNRVPIDYAMNEACSAGTGSFLEESASGDLNIERVEDIGPIALNASSPLKFGEHCSAFINSDIRKAIQLGASREDITAGIITSIVSNYLNRVVGNRTIGQNIVLQGGVAKNEAVPMAFALLLDKDIIIPPDPELLGAFGVAVLAKEKLEGNFIDKQAFDIDEICNSNIHFEREFTCRACDNYCPVRVLKVNDHSYMFGGRCNKYANMRKKKNYDDVKVYNYIDKRNELMFDVFAPDRGELRKKHEYVVGIPRAFSYYTLWPLYSWFFHLLGIEVRESQSICKLGMARTEGDYCYPAEIAHGAVQDMIYSDVDYIFVPHFRDLESYESHGHANFCPITQSLPYYIEKAFPEYKKERLLAPIISFMYGPKKALESFVEMGEKLGLEQSEVKWAFNKACEKQDEFMIKYREMGVEALERARELDHPVIALLGRPYNAFTRDANMGIPLKFTSRGCTVIPYDMLPFENEKIYDNMYWYYGQEDMKSSMLVKKEPNIFVTFITNFSCAPDSFILHYLKWMMGTKPFLVLELDSHSADAGIDTRIEAFLDIIEGYKIRSDKESKKRYDNGLRFINNGKEKIHVYDEHNNKKEDIFNNERVKILLSNMGQLTTELLAASIRTLGAKAQAMPLPDSYILQMARNYMSGKECLPSQLVLGSALSYFASEEYSKDEIYLLFVPTTTGPCRTGQYFVFYENLFKDLEIENVVLFTLDSDNSYNELGDSFSKSAWWGLMIADYMKDIETALRTCAVNPEEALVKYNSLWKDLVSVVETDMSQALTVLKNIATEISAIPLKFALKDVPKVLVVGEIYVRRDDFAVDELIQIMSAKGIMAKVSGVTEWIYYCDSVRRNEILKRYNLLPFYKRIFSKEARELLMWKIEAWWKHRVESKIKKTLSTTGLIPHTPHNMEEIISNSEKFFVSKELYSEITISTGVGATALMDDYSGVINISPFACLIGRVIEGLITPWARERRLPVMSVEIDGNIIPPNILSKLEIFMLNVLRFRANPSIDDLITHTEPLEQESKPIEV